MSNIGKQMIDALKAIKDVALTVAPGLKDFGPEVKAEVSRLGTQGAAELASALFGNGAFVPYGPGQITPSPEHSPAQDRQLELIHGGMER